MSELAYQNEGIKVTNTLVGEAALQRVWLWDLGLKKPEPPKRPKAPKGTAGEPEFDLAMVEFKEQLEEYEAALKRYRDDKAAFAKWERDIGGPVEKLFWSCDASDALARDPQRYCISARTRGHERRPNGGLPDGMKPGKAHAANLQREQEQAADLAAAMRRDPVFGQEELRQ